MRTRRLVSHRRRGIGAGLAAGITAALATASAGAAPIVYTGELLAENGLPFEGEVSAVVSVYASMAGGSPLWVSDPLTADAVSGAVELSLEAPALDAVLAANPNLWLQFEIDGEVLEPRQQMSRVPFAAVCDNAQMLGGKAASEYLQQGATVQPSALPTNGLGQIANGALNNQFDDVTYAWSGSSPIGDSPDPGGQASVTSSETGDSYLTSVSIQTSYSLLFESQIELILYPPPAAGLPPIVLQAGLRPVGVHAATWTPGNTPALTALLGKKVEGQWAVVVRDLNDNAAPGVVVGQLTAFSVKYDVVRSDHLQVNGLLDVQGDLAVSGESTFGQSVVAQANVHAASLSVGPAASPTLVANAAGTVLPGSSTLASGTAGAIVAPGMTLQTQAYTSDTIYQTASGSWLTGPTFTYKKLRTNSDLLVHGAFPFYITPGGSGYGLRLQYSLNGSTWIDSDLPDGPSAGWGAGGYGGDASGVTPFMDTLAGLNQTGDISFRFQYRVWQTSDTLYFIGYPGHPKRAHWVVQEIAR
jgi:hypothetical protein